MDPVVPFTNSPNMIESISSLLYTFAGQIGLLNQWFSLQWGMWNKLYKQETYKWCPPKIFKILSICDQLLALHIGHIMIC